MNMPPVNYTTILYRLFIELLYNESTDYSTEKLRRNTSFRVLRSFSYL